MMSHLMSYFYLTFRKLKNNVIFLLLLLILFFHCLALAFKGTIQYENVINKIIYIKKLLLSNKDNTV